MRWFDFPSKLASPFGLDSGALPREPTTTSLSLSEMRLIGAIRGQLHLLPIYMDKRKRELTSDKKKQERDKSATFLPWFIGASG